MKINLSVGNPCSSGGHWDVTMRVPGVGNRVIHVHAADGESISDEQYMDALETIVKYENLRSGSNLSRREKMNAKVMDTAAK